MKRTLEQKAVMERAKLDKDFAKLVYDTLVNPPSPNTITCAEDVKAALESRFFGLDHEELHVIFVNRRHGILAIEIVTRGNDAHTIVDPRQVLRLALKHGATAFILAHNHPSGDPAPSMADVEVTNRMQNAAQTIGLEVLDHCIFAGLRMVSMREEGVIHTSTSTGLGAELTGARR